MDSPLKTIAFRPRLQVAEESLRPTRAEVDLGAVAHNFRVVRELAGSARVCAVVKADAYGHGVVPVATRLQKEGADAFGVALAEEGLELREAGVTADILVLNGVYGDAHRDVLEAGLTPVVYDLAQVAAFDHAWHHAPFGIHVKVDSGMGRLGVPLGALDAFLDGLARFPAARVDGVMTHLSSADGDEAYTRDQLDRFRDALARIRARGHAPRTVHAANSPATLAHPGARFDMVRPGIVLFGAPPAPHLGADLRPAMRLRTEVIALRDLAPGDSVGYGRTFRAPVAMRLATVPMGYGDGLMRLVSNRGAMLVGGGRCAIVGNVSMDLTTLDVTGVPDAAVGTEVVVLGEQGGERIGAEDVAEWAGTIPYEVLTNVSRRVPRFYR
jgi:alanine racemase